MLPSASRDVSVKFSDQCINILNNKEILNVLKVITNIQKRGSLFKYQSHIYNFQSTRDINHRGIKMRQNNKLFKSLNIINGKTSPCVSQGIIRHSNYRSNPKLFPGIVVIIIIPCH